MRQKEGRWGRRGIRRMAMLLAVLLLFGCVGCGEPTPDLPAQSGYSLSLYTIADNAVLCAMQDTAEGLKVLGRRGEVTSLTTLDDAYAPAATELLSEQDAQRVLTFFQAEDSLLLWRQDWLSGSETIERDGAALPFAKQFSLSVAPSLAQNDAGEVFALADEAVFSLSGGQLELPVAAAEGHALLPVCLTERGGEVYLLLAEQSADGPARQTVAAYSCKLDDAQTVSLGERLPLKGDIRCAAFCGESLYVLCGDTLYHVSGTEATAVVNLLSLGILGEAVSQLVVREDGKILLALSDSLAVLQPGGVEARTPLRLAVLKNQADGIQKAAAQFNRSSTDYYVEVLPFTSQETMNLAVAAENTYDLLCAFDTDLLASYGNKGILASLDDFEVLQSDELFQNVLNVCRTDGALYYFPPNFRLFGVRVPQSQAGGLRELSVFSAYSDSLSPYAYQNSSTVLSLLLNDGISGYTEADFAALLSYCGRYCADDAQVELEPMAEGYVPEVEKLRFCTISSAENIRYEDGQLYYMNEEAAYVPSAFGGGEGLAVLPGALGMVGVMQSANRSGAEAFLRFLLSEESLDAFDSSDFAGIPLRRTLLPTGGSVNERLLSLASGADHLGTVPDALAEVIYTEAAAYFSGDVPLETCAQRIVDAITLYRTERQ